MGAKVFVGGAKGVVGFGIEQRAQGFAAMQIIRRTTMNPRSATRST